MVGRIFTYPSPDPAKLLLFSAANAGSPTTITVAGSSSYGFVLPIGTSGRGRLTRCWVGQLSGTLAGFTYSLYSSIAACPPGASPLSAATVPSGLYLLVPPIVVTSGHADYQTIGIWPNDGINNLKQSFSTGEDKTNPLALGLYNGCFPGQSLYLAITNPGGNAATFACSLTIEDPIGT